MTNVYYNKKIHLNVYIIICLNILLYRKVYILYSDKAINLYIIDKFHFLKYILII